MDMSISIDINTNLKTNSHVESNVDVNLDITTNTITRVHATLDMCIYMFMETRVGADLCLGYHHYFVISLLVLFLRCSS